MNPLQSMRMFCCLVEARGFSAAAERLDMSHSTVSRQLKQLEASVGVQLVNRNTRRFALTAAGERYYQYSVDILARVEAMSLAMTDERQHLAGALRHIVVHASWLLLDALQRPVTDQAARCAWLHQNTAHGDATYGDMRVIL